MAEMLNKSRGISSLTKLEILVAYAKIDSDLFHVLQIPHYRSILKKDLMEHYFPSAIEDLNYARIEMNIEQQILHESAAQYRNLLEQLGSTISKDQLEEELYVRGGVFK